MLDCIWQWKKFICKTVSKKNVNLDWYVCKFWSQKKVKRNSGNVENWNAGPPWIKKCIQKFQDVLDTKLTNIGCATHLINNAINAAENNLSVDSESITVKINSYFLICTMQVETIAVLEISNTITKLIQMH